MSRAYIAMVIAQKSRYILLDEPASDLDIEHQIRLMEILEELAKRGCGIIMTSHDIPMALTYSKEVLLIENGRIVDDGSPDEIDIDVYVRYRTESGDEIEGVLSNPRNDLQEGQQVRIKYHPKYKGNARLV